MEKGWLLNQTYQVIRPIGSGGLGEVYLGYHKNLEKYVVIKKVKDSRVDLVNNRIEVDILKSLHHMYLPQVYDFVETPGGVFTVMDYISGQDLKHYIDDGYTFSEEQLVIWMKQMCEVLEYLHSRKPCVIHCDIKPANIMITEEGNICLIDFNISLDGENSKDLIGLSSIFASPEQVKKAEYTMRYQAGDQVKMDERTDIYSTGAVFYYLMTGIRPDSREEIPTICGNSRGYSRELENIVWKAMARDPSKRFRSAAKMREALEHMERWSDAYQELSRKAAILDLTAGCSLLVLLCLMILGYRGMKGDQYDKAYRQYIQAVETWDQEQEPAEEADLLIRDGVEMLNQSDYAGYLKKNKREKANVLFGIGRASLVLENYGQAEEYLLQAQICDDTNKDIYRELALCQIHLGEIEAAKQSLQQGVFCGMDFSEQQLLEAEIYQQTGEYKKAWKSTMQAAESQNEQVVLYAANLALKIHEQLQNTGDCVAFLKQMQKKSSGGMKTIWTRKLGECCLKAEEAGTSGYLDTAIRCLEELESSGYSQKTDLYNLAAAYELAGNLEKSKNLLLSMQQNYPEEYKIPLQLAYLYYRSENKKAIDRQNFTKVNNYYKQAVQLCEEQNIDPSKDVNMVNMKNVIEQLQDQGLLRR